MNPKMKKLQADLEKNKEKISELQGRSREIERQITELKNNDILALVHRHDLDMEKLSALIHAMSRDPVSALRGDAMTTKEEPDHEY